MYRGPSKELLDATKNAGFKPTLLPRPAHLAAKRNELNEQVSGAPEVILQKQTERAKDCADKASATWMMDIP